MRYLPAAILILTLAAFIGGCGPPGGARPDGGGSVRSATRLAKAGKHAAAADVYLRLARSSRAAADLRRLYHLRAAEALLAAGQPERAVQAIAVTEPVTGEAWGDALRPLLLARLALHYDDPERALAVLRALPARAAASPPPPLPSASGTAATPLDRDGERGIPPPLLSEAQQLRAEAHEALGQYLYAAVARLRHRAYLSGADALRGNSEQIWRLLNQVDTADLRRAGYSASETLDSWIELTLLNRAWTDNPAALQRSVAAWRARHSAHPAVPTITDKLLQISRLYGDRPAQLALLLPLTGPYEKAAEAIRDGFLTSWYQSEEYRPTVKIYNTDAPDIRRVYDQALAEGARLVVGPLEKQALDTLRQSGDLPVVTLALNQTDDAPPPDARERRRAAGVPKLIQFGLSPEDEAEQAAARAAADGHVRALILTPDNHWGRRIAAIFSREWERGGGRVLDSVAFPISERDTAPGAATARVARENFATPVKQLLNVDSSESRVAGLREILPTKIFSDARLRRDADMIFLAAPPLYARQLVPQFRFHKAGDIPIYATSHVFSGVVNPAGDKDMNGVRFIDIPWILSAAPVSAEIRRRVNRSWKAEQSPYRRLYALGVDSFHLLSRLSRLALQPGASYAGETGVLSLDDKGHIRRQLLWGAIRNGRPRLLPR